MFFLEFKKVCRLSLPIMGGGIIGALIPFANTVYMGRLGPTALAAGGIVNSFFVFIMVLAWGVFSTVGSLIARYEGAEDPHATGELVKTALILAMLASIPVILIFHYSDGLLIALGQQPGVVTLAHQYFKTLSFAILPDFLLTVLYYFCYGLSEPRRVLILSMLLLPLSLVLNHAFIFGDLGLPAFGIAGVGVGTSLAYWILLGVMALWIYKSPTMSPYFLEKSWFVKKRAKELISVGIPVGVMWVFEVGFMTAVSLLMGHISNIALAAHQIAFQTYMIFFTLLYSFSQAVSIRVGDGLGAKQKMQVLHAYYAGLFFALLLSVLMMLILYCGDHLIIALVLGAGRANAIPLVQLTTHLLWIAPLFFVFDALAFITFSTLRAFKDTRYTMMVALCVYWCVMLPVMVICVDVFGMDSPLLLWALMALGACLSLIFQGQRFYKQYALT